MSAPTLPFMLRMPTGAKNPDPEVALNVGAHYVDVQVIIDLDMELRGECRYG